MSFSLGTSAGAGTITIVAGGTVVTGTGTNFVAANIGAILVVGAQWGVIATRTSTTSVTLDRPVATAVTGSDYTISANIPVITQTGTDTSLAGLTGVPGVTTSTNLWTITSSTLVINGSLTINRLTNRLRFLNPANLVTSAVTPPTFTIGATGTFNNSVTQSLNGYTYRSSNYSIMFDGAIPVSVVATAGNLIGTAVGSTSIFEGNIEFANTTGGATTSVLMCNFEGTTTLQYGALLNSSATGSNILFFVTNGSSNLTLNNYTSVGISLRVANNTLNINNYAATAGPNAININTSSAINNAQYVGLQSLGSNASIRTASSSLKYFQVINYSDTALVPTTALASNTGSQFLLVNQLILSATGSAGAIQNVKFWARDSNNGSRSPTNYGAGLGYEIATTGNLTYTATTAVNGIAPTLNIISVIYWQPTASTTIIDYRGNNGAQDLNIYQCAYNYVLSNSLTALWTLNNGVYGGASARNQGFVLLADTSVTQSTMATVAAYTALNTAQELYDYAKYYLYANFVGQTATYVTRSGDVINAGSYNVTIDATAATPFVFAGSTITAKSSTFTGSLTTSGAVTLTNGAVFSGNMVTANVSQATPTNFTGVTINGNLTYNTNTPITITLTNCAISGTVSNSGSGLVTISLTNSTIGSVGSNVESRITTSLNINGLTAGSQVYVANGSGTQVAYVASSGTSYTLDTSGETGTWTWKVARYGFTSQTGTHSPAVASTTTTVTLLDDAFITQATKATVAVYEFLPNMDTLYDYAAYYETLEIGIPYSRIITKAGTNASAGSYSVELNDLGDLFIFDGSSLSIYTGTSLDAGTTITGALFSSSNVTIPTVFGNTAITANVIQISPGDLSGMAITGNLTYNETAPFGFTATITNSTITGTISNSGTAPVKVIKAGTSPFFTAGANVTVVAVVSITTANNLALSTYIIKNGSSDLGWVAQNTARSLEVSATDVFRIYAIAYGYQPVLFTGIATDPTSFRTSLLPETFVDTTLPTVIRDAIADTIAVEFAAGGLLVTYFSEDLSQYSPANVLNGFQYYTVIDGDKIGLGSILANSLDGFAIISGGFEISSPAFYAQVDDSVTSVGPAGFSVPVVVRVTPSVYDIDPAYTPTRKNSSGIVLQTAPWTQQTAAISQSDKADIRTGLALEETLNTVKSNTNLIPGLY